MKPYPLLLLLCMIASFGCSQPSAPVAKNDKPNSASPASPQAAQPELPVFGPDPELAQQLGEPVEVAEYTMRGPKIYALTKPALPQVLTTANGSTSVSAWGGVPRANGSSPMCMILTATLPPNEPMQDFSVIVQKMLNGVKIRRTNWKQSESSYGMLGGIKFARVEWTGMHPGADVEMAGIMYVGVDQRTIIQLHTQDVSSETDALKLGETALLSFTKK